MDAREYQEVKSSLLTTINLLSPNGKIQRAFVDSLHAMELGGCSPELTIKDLVGQLYDGLAYGNWPKKSK